jgi:hypothetical protein
MIKRPGRSLCQRVAVAACGLAAALAVAGTDPDVVSDSAYTQPSSANGTWWPPGYDGSFPAAMQLADSSGKLGVVKDGGGMATKGHPFFEPIGGNGRACITCHQPENAMSLSVATAQRRWNETNGKDPLFAAMDGSNCPSLPQDDPASHSLLLERGLIRIALPWPPKGRDGTPLKPEFTLAVVSDPTGCNLDPQYGLNSSSPAVSVFRRPRMVANLKYIARPGALFNLKTGLPMAVDPETGRPVSMNLMSDARELTLKSQAVSAALEHLQAAAPPSAEIIRQIVEFETHIYVAQAVDEVGGRLEEPNGPEALGPSALLAGVPGQLGDNTTAPVFGHFDVWAQLQNQPGSREQFRASVARGAQIFLMKTFWIRDSAFLNSVQLGNPVRRTCSSCHGATMTGQDLAPGWMDIGIANEPWAPPSPELPLFKLICRQDVMPHPYLGRVILTHDPGRALITGRCEDIGAITMQQFRGLAARAPYFSNGSAKDLRAVVDFYDTRYDIGYTEQEKQDLANFLSVL